MSRGPLCRPGTAVESFGPECIPHIDEGENSGAQGDLFAFQPAGIARSVPFFTMTKGDVQGGSAPTIILVVLMFSAKFGVLGKMEV